MLNIFDLLMGAKERLLAAETAHPNSEPLRRLHARALRLVRVLKNRLDLTEEEFAQLIEAPQGGGTNKDEE